MNPYTIHFTLLPVASKSFAHLVLLLFSLTHLFFLPTLPPHSLPPSFSTVPVPCYPPDPVGTNLRQGTEDPESGDDNDGQVRPILLLPPLLFQTQYSPGEDTLLFNAHR